MQAYTQTETNDWTQLPATPIPGNSHVRPRNVTTPSMSDPRMILYTRKYSLKLFCPIHYVAGLGYLSHATENKMRARERLREVAPEREPAEKDSSPHCSAQPLTAASVWVLPLSQPGGSADNNPKTFLLRSFPASYLQGCVLRSNFEKRLRQSEKRTSNKNENSNKSSSVTNCSKILYVLFCFLIFTKP